MSLLRLRLAAPPPTMDYLTVFATRSLVLFPRSSSTATPVPPANHQRTLSPHPVEMPLYALMRDDTHCAWYLVDRVLEAPRAAGGVARELEMEAEVLVWEQIDRAKMFGRALALLFGSSSNVSEEELRELAAKHGLGLAVPSGGLLPVVQRHYREEAAPILA
ncbi:hypothetical protein CC85DRAFT_324355 [Cutaneotrichosporon oleaginosum]|uniref:Uncharacterized protein n=1 Tax=Cutaneotrichosporon oleaginosum TaxID=879819 RepID=A0A0J0XDT6_9TREE|nr:uncharacterized protein CC85DRAFT_324355 [Cutaneotrichosporon oleaginosum]KLT39237.1 hypothetical protein CC85DRAFT_324355 [Cutaneotrichosporon oleaginosum]TXT05730.1 hypothetical protein COLE_07050 [Cutaneotrichosporon oleaginosum]